MDLGPRLGTGRTAEVYAIGDDRVVKLFYGGVSGETVEREARNTEVASEAGAPAPAVYGTVDRDGRRGIVLDRVEGPTLLDRLRSRPWTFPAVVRRLADLQASIHTLEAPGLPSHRERTRARIESLEAIGPETRGRVLDCLDALPGGEAICHGDFHPENVILTDGDPVVIDWLDATAGPAAADVARTALLLSIADLPDGAIRRRAVRAFRSAIRGLYLRQYVADGPATREPIAAWELPVAAARLGEDVADEEALLRARIA